LIGFLGLAGLVVAVVLLVVRFIFKKGLTYKNIGVLAGVALALFIVGLIITPSAKESFNAGREAGQQAAMEADSDKPENAQEQHQTVSPPEGPDPEDSISQKQSAWNTKDVNIESNGNISIAVRELKNSGDIKSRAENVPPATVMKSPWKYYGKIVKLTGEVGIAQDYPPGSDISKSFGGGEVGELVLVNEDSTFIDYINVGSTGDINVGDKAVVYGYPVGLVEVGNKLGGKTTQLVIVGNVVEKVTK